MSAEPSPLTSDQAVKFVLRELSPEMEADGHTVPQVFYPGYFKLRVIRHGKPKMLDVTNAPTKSLHTAFEGMKIQS